MESFHNAGLAVILDAVYNHAGVPNHLGHLDRELYFTIDELGRLTNHSGCGNGLELPIRTLSQTRTRQRSTPRADL